MSEALRLIFLHMVVLWFQQPRVQFFFPFLRWIALKSFLKLIVRICVGLFLDFAFCSCSTDLYDCIYPNPQCVGYCSFIISLGTRQYKSCYFNLFWPKNIVCLSRTHFSQDSFFSAMFYPFQFTAPEIFYEIYHKLFHISCSYLK